MTTVISKRQAKFARYLANCAFGKSGRYCKRDGKKERTYITSGCALIWTEATVPGGLEIEVLKATWNNKKYSEGMLVFSPEHMDFEAAMVILASEDSHYHEDVVQLAPTQEAEAQPVEEFRNMPEQVEEFKKDLEEAVLELVTPKVEVITPPQDTVPTKAPEPKAPSAREKLARCATMRLAEENGIEIDADFDAAEAFSKIVGIAGDKAVRRYQELLSSVPAYGLTESRIRLAFPREFETLF